MARPTGSRSKQNSAPSVPLPGIALGLFAAVAAGFAASRALRRKKLPRSLEGEKQSIFADNSAPNLDLEFVQEREIENKEKDDSDKTSGDVVNAKGTIIIAQEHSEFAAGLKPAFEAFEKGSTQTRDMAIKPLQEDKGQKQKEKDCRDGKREEEGAGGKYKGSSKKTPEIFENGNTRLEKGVVADITLGFDASLIVDEISMAALQEKETGKEEAEKYEEEAGRGNTETEEVEIAIRRDARHDIDDDEISSDSQPFPVLINGGVLDFFEELPEFKEDTDLSGGSYSLSDTVSESSLQEVTSAPVRPFVPTEEYMEASWAAVVDSDAIVAMSRQGDKKAFAGDELGCDHHEGKEGAAELEVEEPPFYDEAEFEMVADVLGAEIKEQSLAFGGTISLTGNGCDEGVAGITRINGKVFTNGSIPPEEMDLSDGSDEDMPVLRSTGEINVSIDKLEDFTQPARINGKLFQDESPVDASTFRVVIVDRNGSEAEQELGDVTMCDSDMEPDLPPSLELSDKKTCGSSEGEPNDDDDEPLQQEACLGADAAGKGAVSEVDVKESVPDCAKRNADIIDSSERVEIEAVLHEDQSSSTVARKEGSDSNMTSCSEESMDGLIISSGSEAGVSDGLGEEIVVEEITCVREEETGEEMVVEEITCAREEETGETTRSYDARDLIVQPKKHAPANSTEKDEDSTVSKGPAHYQDLQQKGGFSSKLLQYLPLELGFFCLLVALISFMMFSFEASTPLQQS